MTLIKALVTLVMSAFFIFSTCFAQSKIITPETSGELQPESFSKDSKEVRQNKTSEQTVDQSKSSPPLPPRGHINTATPRSLRKNGLGIGLGQTFLMNDYSKHGDDKITMDLFYSYTASYSFDLLVNAHHSEHISNGEKIKLRGINSSVKARLFEFDNFSPFVFGGLGFYAPRAKRLENNTMVWSEQKISFGMTIGTGVDLRLNENFVVGLIAQLHLPFEMKFENQSKLKGYYSKLLITSSYLF